MGKTLVELWRTIPEYEGFYEASSLGRIRSVDRSFENAAGNRVFYRGRVRALRKTKFGYFVVNVSIVGKCRTRRVHQLVASAFLGEQPAGKVVCHNNGVATDNQVSNLRYADQSENLMDKSKHGTCHNSRKTHCPRGHEYNVENTYLRQYKNSTKVSRQCRQCSSKRASR